MRLENSLMASEQEKWDPCPPGELANMVRARGAQRRRKTIDRAAGVAAGLIICIAVGAYTLGIFTPEPSNANYGGLACSEVAEKLPAYVEGDVDPQLQQRMAVHLDKCDYCRSRYQQMVDQVAHVVRSAVLLAFSSENAESSSANDHSAG